MPTPTQAPQIELRYVSGAEVRLTAPDSRTIRGYGVVFNSESNELVAGGRRFTEIVRPESVRGIDFGALLSMHNHDRNRLLGNTRAGTMRIGTDAKGVWYETDVPASPTGDDVLESVKRGDTQDSSFQFSLAPQGDKWEMRDGRLYREILQFSGIYEMGPVSEGAYPDTTVAKRSLEQSAAALPAIETRAEESPNAIAYVIDSSAYAVVRTNDLTIALNSWRAYYLRQAGEYPANAAVYQALAEACTNAKDALVQLINTHADAIKTLNTSEQRADDTTTETRSDFPALDFRLKGLEVQH